MHCLPIVVLNFSKLPEVDFSWKNDGEEKQKGEQSNRRQDQLFRYDDHFIFLSFSFQIEELKYANDHFGGTSTVTTTTTIKRANLLS